MIFCLTILSLCFLEVLVDKFVPKRVLIKIIKRMCGEA